MKEFEYHGIWWTPDNTEKKFPGILTFSNDKGLRLKTFFVFQDIAPNSLASDFDSYEVILGVTNKTRITLCNCKKINFNLFYGLDACYTNEYNAELGFLGKHFPGGLSTTKFSRVRIDYTYLSNWANLSRYDYIPDKDGNPNNFSLEFKKADDISLNLEDSELTIFQKISVNLKLFQVNQQIHSYLEFIPKNALTFDGFYQNYLIPFKQLLSFVTDKTNYITELIVWTEDDDIDGTEVVFEKIKLANEELDLRNMIFTLREIQDKIEPTLNLWFDLYKKNQDIINLFFIAKVTLYGENKILFLAQIFEGYHRRMLSQDGEDKSAFEIRVEKIFNDNIKILEELLKTVIEKLEDKIKKKILNRFIDNLVEKIKKARHYYSHYYNETDQIFYDSEQLFRVTQIMRLLFKSSLLRDMKFDEEFIVDKITNESDFRLIQKNIKNYSLLT